MKHRATDRGSVRFVCAALLGCFAIAPGCGRPHDESWLQFLGFKQGGATIGSYTDTLRGASTATVDVEFANSSLNIGQKVGTGVVLQRARIDYRMAGFSPPATEIPLNLYLPPPADGAATTGTLADFPLVPTSLKHWLIDTGAFEDAAAEPVVELTARVVFFGETDEGADLETEGSIGIALTNTGGTSSGTLPTVDVFVKNNAAEPSTNGAFRVFRSGSITNTITVSFSTSGFATAGVHYEPLGTSVTVPAGADSAIITVIPIDNGDAFDDTLKLTILGGATYTLGTHTSDTMTIIHN